MKSVRLSLEPEQVFHKKFRGLLLRAERIGRDAKKSELLTVLMA